MTAVTIRKIGRYEVERELAEGGMGVVYLARQPSLERLVVLKRMRRELAHDEEIEERFWREARTAASIHHPNIVCVYDCFPWRGEPYIACEYVDGVDASTALAKSGGMPPRIAALIALEIVRGLDELHARALVHRDLKPDNVLLGRAGEVKIGDFGVAHDARARALTRSGVSIGTPAYMPPEQLRGEKVDARADLFSLGVLLYELIAGELPFPPHDERDEQQDGGSLLKRIEQGSYVPLRRAQPSAPRRLARLVDRCLIPSAKRRVPNAAEIGRSLEAFLGTTPPVAARAELAAWLATAKVLPSRGRTRRAPKADTEAARGTSRRWLALAAALAGLLAAAATLPAWPLPSAAWIFAQSEPAAKPTADLSP